MRLLPALAALSIALAAPAATPVAAQGGLCGMAADFVVKKMLTSYGVVTDNGITLGEGAYDAVSEYLKERSDQRLSAATRSLARSILKETVPGAGPILDGGGAIVDGVQMTIDEAQKQRLQAFLCGARSYGDLTSISFFEMREVQALAPGITCDNLERYITTGGKLRQLQAIWEGRFTRETRQYRGNDAETAERLGVGWAVIRQRFLEAYAPNLYDEIQRQLRSDSITSTQQCLAPPPSDAPGGALHRAPAKLLRESYTHTYPDGTSDSYTFGPALAAVRLAGAPPDWREVQWEYKNIPTSIVPGDKFTITISGKGDFRPTGAERGANFSAGVRVAGATQLKAQNAYFYQGARGDGEFSYQVLPDAKTVTIELGADGGIGTFVRYCYGDCPP